MAFSVRSRWQAASRRQRLLVLLAALYLLYTLLGFFLVSPLLKQQLTSTLQETTGREVRLERVLFNPLTLSLTLENFGLLDEDGTDFIAFDRFYANFQLSSLFRRSWHFRQIALTRPRTQVTQVGEGQFNFDDLLALATTPEETATGAESAPAPEDTASAPLPALSVSELLLEEGDFRFVDRTGETPRQMVLAPVSFRVEDFSTRSSGEGDGNSYNLLVTGPGGGSFNWTGHFSLNPLIATGELALNGVDLPPFADFLSDQLRFTVPSGELSIQTAYRLETGDDLRLWLTEGAVQLNQLVIHDPAQDIDVVTLPKVALGNVRLDTTTRTLTLGDLTLATPAVRARLLAEGVDLATLFTPVQTTPVEDAPAEQDDTPVGEPWALILETLHLNAAQLALRDETLPTPGELALAPVTLTLRDLALNDPRRFSLDGEATFAESGQIALGGEGQIAPLDIQLTLAANSLPLPALQPWVQSALRVTVPAGTASADLTLRASGEDDVTVRVTGGAGVQNLDVRETGDRPLLALKELALTGLDVDTHGQRLRVQQARVTGLDARALIDPQGRGVADRILLPGEGSSEPGAPWHIRLDELVLADSQSRFTDLSQSPDFSLALTRLNGTLTGLDSAARAPANIDLSARVDQYAPLSVKGALNPLAANPSVDLTITLNGYEMTSLTPFTGRYLGYATRTGQLSVDSSVKLDGSVLDSRTRVKAASFFLGDRVPSDEALSVPIKLGLAVIRDRNALIDLPVQARGDLNDPSVSVHGIILKALTNILVRAATSPFSVLASLAGGENLEHISFPAGSAEPDSDTREQLATLAQVLTDRPTLGLTLAGSTADSDRDALARRRLGTELAGRDWQDLASAQADRGFQRRTLALYRDRTGNEPDTLLPPLADGADKPQRQAREQALAVAAFEVLVQQQAASLPADLLQTLASQRAQQAKTLLIDDHALSGERLRITGAPAGSADAVAGVSLGLSPD
ncbi:hypothetical protein A167_00224 [Alcanivorax sp. S71-1-4]|uniref:DUF748 domain-containing protein n=1 Tax=Alcanivorax sp. S71-1-4 TaxID=1177159 RepID=UPI0013582E47|nr:DUF748 domain-containing protein [Alcanivorax sp. S71-1-4]KAF0811192.1 hypothetical protein A167_00224 [Alcanivorax sp. S71-1-4]